MVEQKSKLKRESCSSLNSIFKPNTAYFGLKNFEAAKQSNWIQVIIRDKLDQKPKLLETNNVKQIFQDKICR